MGHTLHGRQRRGLVLAKFARPSLPSNYQSRPRLVKLLDSLRHQRLVCIIAPAGYGKTCTAVEYACHVERKGASTAWLTVDPVDNDASRFWAHMASALGLPDDIDLAFGDDVYADMPARVGNALYETLADDCEFFLFIDGFDLVENEKIEASLLSFCACAPTTLHVVVTAASFSRRFEAEVYLLGEVHVGIDELALTEQESRAMMENLLQEELVESEFESVQRLVEGWPQGIVIAGRAIMSRVCKDDPAPFGGANRYVRRYFESHVRSRLPGELTAFLLELSVFERFNRALCDAVFEQENVQALFNEIVRCNLFVVACDDDDNWYRFNGLFVDWLRAELLQLRMETIRENCSRASEWFHDHGYDEEAAKYLLLASDFSYVANLTEATCSLSRCDKKTHYLLWQCRIASAELADSPLLCMLSVWSYITNARIADAQTWIKRFEQCVHQTGDTGGLSPDIVEFSLKCLTMKCTAMAGDGVRALAQCEELLNSGYEIKPSLMSMICQSQGEALERIGDMSQAQEVYLQAQASASVDATMHQFYFNAFSFAEVDYRLGKLDSAREGCERLLQTCPADFSIYGGICALLARVLLEQNEKERASALVARSFKRVSHYRHIDMYLQTKTAQADCLLATGNLSKAYEVIVEGILYGEQKDVPRAMLLYAYFMQARIALHRHNLRDLCVIERKFEARVHKDDRYCQLQLSYIRAAIEHERDNYEAAALGFQDVADGALKKQYMGLVVKALVAEVMCLEGLGDASAARIKLGELLNMASRYGFVRTLLDAGEPLRSALQRYSTAGKAGKKVRSYVKSLLIEFEKERPSASLGIDGASSFSNYGPDPLTPRELEILRLLNMGMSRQEIADSLCISINTAKKHLANIYSKLGVRTREEALRKCIDDNPE